ncbi:MAG: Jag N-terminal domain-containing protein, partial [Desulfovibrio sp.]|nr:Jag N-terminal domain-containing protein [Desulfovibrio sp.]
MDAFKEFQGKDIESAIAEACNYFNVNRKLLEIEILRDAKTGIFGIVSSRPASIRARLSSKALAILEQRKLEQAARSLEQAISYNPYPRPRMVRLPASVSRSRRQQEQAQRMVAEAPCEPRVLPEAPQGLSNRPPQFKRDQLRAKLPKERLEERPPRAERRGFGRVERGGDWAERQNLKAPRILPRPKPLLPAGSQEVALPLTGGPKVERTLLPWHQEVEKTSLHAQQEEERTLLHPHQEVEKISLHPRQEVERNSLAPHLEVEKTQSLQEEVKDKVSEKFVEDSQVFDDLHDEFPEGLPLLSEEKLTSPEFRAFVENVLQKIASPIVGRSVELSFEFYRGRLHVHIDGGECSGLLIGRDGQTLNALRFLTSRILTHAYGAAVRLMIDVGEFRQRQEEKLNSMAQVLVEKVRQTGRSCPTKPLSSFQRRLVHVYLQNFPDIQSKSVGAGAMKRV